MAASFRAGGDRIASRRGRGAAVAFLAALCLVGLWPPAALGQWEDRAGLREPEVTLISQDEGQVVFEVAFEPPAWRDVVLDDRPYVEVHLPGLTSAYRPGAPDLPQHSVMVAVPPGTEPVVRLIGGEEELLVRGRPLPIATERYDPPEDAAGTFERNARELYQHTMRFDEDPSIYASGAVYPAGQVRGERVSRWRTLRVQPVEFFPVRYHAGEGAVYYSSRLRVQVRFVPIPAPAGAQETQRLSRPFPREESRWESIYERRLVNYESARAFKRLPLEPRSLPRLRVPQEGTEYRIRVDSTRIYAVRFEDLARGGLITEPVDWNQLRLEVREYDAENPEDPFQSWEIAFLPEDNDEDGRFGEEDRLIFHGEDAWDFFDFSPADKRYLRHNVYWLVVGAGAGPQMQGEVAWLDEDLPRPQGTYTRTQHFEQDRYYMSVLAGSDIPNPQAGPWAFRTDHYNWTHPDWIEGTQAKPIKVAAVDLPDVLQVQEICVHLQGQEELAGYGTHHTRLWISRSSSAADTSWAFPGNPYRVRELGDILTCVTGTEATTTPLSRGRNYFKVYVPREGDGIDDVSGDGLGIDWIEITYLGLSKMWNHELLMPMTGLSGPQAVQVNGCETTDMLAFDLGNPRQPRQITLADSLFAPVGSSYQLKIQLDFGEPGTDRTLYFVERDFVPSIDPTAISLRRTVQLTEFDGEDYVAIYPERFEEPLLPLLEHREDVTGHQVLRAPVEAVFDTYSGGRRHPFAIKRLLREMWRVSDVPPDYLLVVGDASNDIASYTIDQPSWNADSNYVPVMTIAGHAAAGSAYQVVSSDHWFVDNLTGEWDDPMTMNPDMFVGRISCGNEEEVSLSVEKIIGYELDDHEGRWRSHVVMHADDAFSSRIAGLSGSGLYTIYTSEWTFLRKCQESVDYIRSHPAFDHFVIDTLYQSAVMDSVPSLGRCVLDATAERCSLDAAGEVIRVPYPTEVDQNASWQYGSTEVRDILLDQLNQGALLWAYQGHSNHKLVAHELIFQHSTTSSAVNRLSNIGKPFIFMGFGCHLGEYAHHQEGYPIRGDCMAEEMLFCCDGQNRGAIAALGSTDYEWVHHSYQLKVFQAMMAQPPRSQSGESRWRLGEIISEAKMLLPPNEEERITYTLLGDPALRVGIAPPVLEVTLNDEPWIPGEAEAFVSSQADDSLTVRLQVYDESHLDLGQIRIKDYRDGAYDWVPDTTLTLIESPDDRQMLIEYRTQLLRRPYDLVLEAVDYEGSVRTVSAPVILSLAFFEDVDGSLIALPESGAVVSDSTRLVLSVRTSVHLDETGFLLEAGGIEVPVASVESRQEEGGGLYRWTVRFEALGFLPDGDTMLEFLIEQRDGTLLGAASQPVEVGAERLRFRSQYWVPSPFTTATTLVYDLSLAASRARLRVYTVTGRRILEENMLPVSKGVNYFQWNGRDADGDPIANGLYFYELAVWDQTGKKVSVIEKVVRAR